MEPRAERRAALRYRRLQQISALSLSDNSQTAPPLTRNHTLLGNLLIPEREGAMAERSDRHVTFLGSDSLSSGEEDMDEVDLQTRQSGWEEIMKYKAAKVGRPSYAESTPDTVSLPGDPSSMQETWSDITGNDGYDSQSESGTYSSIAFSSASGSRSTVTSLSMTASCIGEDDSQDNVGFPSYDDVGYYGHFEDLEPPPMPRTDHPYTPSLTFSTNVSRPESPQSIQHPEDDTAVRFQPSRHVDYLSHDWREEDIWASWKHIVSRRKAYASSTRLSNASWRTWGQRLWNLETVSPETLNWLKDCDVTWLYGPLARGHLSRMDLARTTTSEPKVDAGLSRNSLAHKPSLKRRNMPETLLQYSLSSASLLKQAAAAVQAQQSKNRPNTRRIMSGFILPLPPRQTSRSNETVRYSMLSSGLPSLVSGPKKRIHFNDQVEQFVSLDIEGDDTEAYHIDDKYNSDSVDGTITKRGNLKRTSRPNEILDRKASSNSLKKMVARIEPAALNYREDAAELPEAVSKNESQSTGKLRPVPLQKTLRPSEPSTRMLLGEDPISQPPSIVTNLKATATLVEKCKDDSPPEKVNDNLTWQLFTALDGTTPTRKAQSEDSSEDKQPFRCLESNQSHQPPHEEPSHPMTTFEPSYLQRGLSWLTEKIPVNLNSGCLTENFRRAVPGASPEMHHFQISNHLASSGGVERRSPMSVVDFLYAHGRDSSFSARKKYARDWGITGALGSPEWNRALLEKAKAVFGGFDAAVTGLTSDNSLWSGEVDLNLESDGVRQTIEMGESPSESMASMEHFPGSHDESNEEMDEDETTTDCGTSGSETGSSDGVCSDICKLEYDPNSHQDFISPVLDPMRQALVGRVMEEFWIIFNQNWDVSVNECAGGASDTPGRPSRSTISPPSTSLLPSQRKRQREEDEEPDESNRNDPRKPRHYVDPGSIPENISRFACPFRKHDPGRYSMHSHRVCALSSWDSIARVKEHLYRCHQMVRHCRRCWKTFKAQTQLDSHMTVAAADICEVQPVRTPEGITPDQEKRLRSRKKTSPTQSDEDRWKDIYRLLFPNEEIPSPYFELVQEEGPMSPDGRDLAGYEDYIRRELPRLVRSNIEEVARRDMQPLEASLIGSLVGIIQDCQDRVFRAYRQTQNLDDDVAMPRSEDRSALVSPKPLDSTEDEVPRHSLGSYPERLEFLDRVFQPPLAQVAETGGPIFESTASLSGVPGQSAPSDMMFSDSGYVSELGAMPDENQAVEYNPLSGINEIGTGDVDWNDLNDLTFNPSWSEMDSMGENFNW